MTPDPLIGRTIGHYRVLDRLGEGGMGVVYLAEDLSLRRRVALKFLLPDAVADPEARARLVHEARAAAALIHPNICPVYEIAEADGRTFIAMAHLEGGTLRERLQRGAVPLADALAIARQLADALGAAHAQGIVHRDVKPENVLLLPDGRPVLTDFGLARVAGATQLTRTGATPGTAAYMAPERALGRDADARSDVWALGVVLYELVSGRQPFTAASPAAQLYEIMNAEPVALAQVAPDAPAGVRGVVARALAKDPARRYGGAAEMAADLAALERATTATPAGAGRPTRRGRAGLAVTVGLGVVALIAVLVALDAGRVRTRFFGGGPVIRSIAVLPLVNLSGDPRQEYFADGMTEALISDLGQVGALRTISLTSAMAYKGARKPLTVIARELGVDAVVEGTVARSGRRVRISARLVRAGAERQLWAEAFEREARDVLALEDEVAATIARAVRARLTAGERARLARTRPVRPEAYEAYLRGRCCAYYTAPDSLRRAAALLRQAIALDPGFAQAQAALSEVCTSMALYPGASSAQVAADALESARVALRLDDDLAEGHAALGWARLQFAWDWAGAGAELRRALELNPGSATVREYQVTYLVWSGQPARAIGVARDLARDEPTSGNAPLNVGWCCFYARRYADAAAWFRRSIALDPASGDAYAWLAQAALFAGEKERALAACDTAEALGSAFVENVGYVYGAAGRRDRALAVLERLRAQERTEYVDPTAYAWVYAGLGDRERTLAALRRGLDARSPNLLGLGVAPQFDAVRGDPRFRALLRAVGGVAPPPD